VNIGQQLIFLEFKYHNNDIHSSVSNLIILKWIKKSVLAVSTIKAAGDGSKKTKSFVTEKLKLDTE